MIQQLVEERQDVADVFRVKTAQASGILSRVANGDCARLAHDSST